MVTTTDVDAFHAFAKGKLNNGGAASMQQLVAQWEASRELDESVAEIRQSMAAADAGELISAEEAFAQARRRLGIIE